jgi:hypothetical protein
MPRTGNQRTLGQDQRDPCLVRTSVPEYSLVGFACATVGQNAVTLTLGLVTGLPYPESRPIRVRMSRENCRELAVALDRVERMVGTLAGASEKAALAKSLSTQPTAQNTY